MQATAWCFGSRTPDKAGLPGPVATTTEAARSADLLLTALPGTASIATLESIGDEVLGSKIVLDVSNAVTSDGTLAYPNDSVARLMQERSPSLRVVKSLNTMFHGIMTKPSVVAPTTVFLSGDDDDAKTVVKSLLRDLGWPTSSQLDLGGVASAVGPEHYAPLFFAALQVLGTPTFNINLVR